MKTHEFVDKYCSYLIILIMSLGLFSCSSGCNTTSNNVANETVIMDSSDGGIADGATNVSLTPSIVLKFSKSMDPTSINNTTITLTDNLSSNLTNKTKQVNNIAIGNIIANADNTKFIFSPESALLANTKYFVKINQAKTSQGIYVSGSFSFTTSSGGVIAPMVSLVTPDNQGINVAISPYITVTFSESVVNVNSDNVWLYQASDAGNKVNLQLIAESGNSYTFAPSSNLSASTNYILAFNTTKIVDLDGNQLTAESFSFTTKNPQWQQMGESLLIPSNIQNADISFANNIPYIAYIDDNNKSSVIQFNYTSNTWQFIGESNLANNVSRVKLAIDPSNSDIYLAYLDDSNNVNILKYNKINNSWGSIATPIANVVFFDFKINPLTQQANIVYSSNNILRLQTWNTNSNAWEQIGTTIDEISSAYLSLAFNKNGQPYVAYTASTADLSSSFVAVKTYDQNSWQDLASPNLVANSQMDNYLQLTISPAQVPYFILSNSDNSEANDLYKPIVMDFTDNNWSYPDNNKLISAGMAIYPHISFNPATGQPYITYADLTSSEIQVLDFNGSSWNKLGSQANFSSSAYNNLGFDAITNEPYVAFLQSTDGNAPYKANLMAYK